MEKNKILIERERIKKLIEEKEKAVEIYCEKKYQRAYQKRGYAHRKRITYNTISKSQVLKWFDWLKFRIDNPDYVRKRRHQI